MEREKGTAVKQKKIERREKVPPKQEKKAYIYLGPNLPGGILFTGAIYKNEIPKYLEDVTKKCKEVEKLFVDITEVSQVKSDLGNPGTEIYRLYQKVLKVREEVYKHGL